MDKLTIDELEVLNDAIEERLPETLIKALINANRKGALEELLSLLCMEDLIKQEERLDTYSNGKIVVIGDLSAKEKDLLGVAKNLGLSKDRFEFVDFNSSVRYDFKKLEWNITIAVVLVGAMPHKTAGSNDSSSAISYIEKNKDKYPKVVRMSANNALKITKTNFKETIELLIKHGDLNTD